MIKTDSYATEKENEQNPLSPCMEKTKKNSNLIIKGFLKRKQEYYKLKKDINANINQNVCCREHSFAEMCGKYKMRDFSHNTRMNIKNQDYFEDGY